MRVARSRELVAQGRPAAVVARVAGISRQAIYRRPKRPAPGQRRPQDDVDRKVLEVAKHNVNDREISPGAIVRIPHLGLGR